MPVPRSAQLEGTRSRRLSPRKNRCQVIPSGEELPCTRRGHRENPRLCKAHRREYRTLRLAYKATSAEVERLGQTIACEPDWQNRAHWNEEDIARAIVNREQYANAIDGEIQGRETHHRRFFAEQDDGHAKWLQGLRGKREKNERVLTQLRRCRDVLASEASQAEMLRREEEHRQAEMCRREEERRQAEIRRREEQRRQAETRRQRELEAFGLSDEETEASDALWRRQVLEQAAAAVEELRQTAAAARAAQAQGGAQWADAARAPRHVPRPPQTSEVQPLLNPSTQRSLSRAYPQAYARPSELCYTGGNVDVERQRAATSRSRHEHGGSWCGVFAVFFLVLIVAFLAFVYLLR
ncbi:hypothetical protein OH77DRAFT_1426725 [Trametes cingulata]|nr:hypothetical protein OH77DRAFT_1426725 [Trametes cingulata]